MSVGKHGHGNGLSRGAAVLVGIKPLSALFRHLRAAELLQVKTFCAHVRLKLGQRELIGSDAVDGRPTRQNPGAGNRDYGQQPYQCTRVPRNPLELRTIERLGNAQQAHRSECHLVSIRHSGGSASGWTRLFRSGLRSTKSYSYSHVSSQIPAAAPLAFTYKRFRWSLRRTSFGAM